MIEVNEDALEDALHAIIHTIQSFKLNIKPFANEIINLCKNGSEKLTENGK
jgi:hypothetical protein